MSEIKHFLPIGTVVLLKNGKKKIMITAYGVFSKEDREKVYEYGACLYPEGITDSDSICAFNTEDIDKIFHLGFSNDEQLSYCKLLEQTYSSIKNKIEKE